MTSGCLGRRTGEVEVDTCLLFSVARAQITQLCNSDLVGSCVVWLHVLAATNCKLLQELVLGQIAETSFIAVFSKYVVGKQNVFRLVFCVGPCSKRVGVPRPFFFSYLKSSGTLTGST